jgi:predicted flap endonuclease-1-like 5' DNA nuclease
MKTARNLTILGIGLSASAIVGWLLLKESKRESQGETAITVKSVVSSTDSAENSQIILPLDDLDAKDSPDESPNADDLTVIKDIGPRFAAALHQIGITSFGHLAKQHPEQLAEQLAPHVSIRAQRIRDKDWIGQATKLAQSQDHDSHHPH